MEVGVNDLREPYDLIIIGTGPAGLTLARKYDELTHGKILIVESGDRSNIHSDAQKLNVVEATGDLSASYYPKHNQRVFGGTSIVWNGWCAVLEKRSFSNGEWPFDYDDLYQYYPEAARILSVPEAVHTYPEKPFLDNPNVVYKPYYFSPPTRFNELCADWVTESASVDVLFNHTVTRVNLKEGIAVSIFVESSSNMQHRHRPLSDRLLRVFGRASPNTQSTPAVEVSGKRIALACGGVQNARLLHLSLPIDNELPIGQYFCQHPHTFAYTHLILDEKKLRQISSQPASNNRIVDAIALSSEFSNAHHLQSATFDISMERKIRVGNILGRSRKVISARSRVRAEMAPLTENRIALSNSQWDVLGQPIAHVSIKFDPREIRAAYEHLNAELIRSGLGRLGVPRKMKRIYWGGGHMMGSTRMGTDPKRSVTDAQGRVHGIENLYVAGSSLFPAVGAANPTLTIVALALRLADRLAGGQNE